MILAADAPSWAIQLGIATPFVLALGFVGKWLVKRLDTVEQEKNLLYEKIINDAIPALKSSTDLAEEMLEAQKIMTSNQTSYVTKLEDVTRLQAELIRQSDDLRRQEIALANRRGTGQ